MLRIDAMSLRALTWNLFHGRDFPPDPALFTRRSRCLRITERNATHVQVNRALLAEFTTVLARSDWDVALLQECPPHWAAKIARALGAHHFRALTSRNTFRPLRRAAAALNPDLVASNEGGSNAILARSEITERRVLVLSPGPRPERRVAACTRLETGVCVANVHLSAGAANRPRAERELRECAERAHDWAVGAPLLLGGDLNIRPRDSTIFGELERDFRLAPPTSPAALDHLLVTGLSVIEAPRAWAPERREVIRPDGLRIRLSDHSPVEALFAS